MENFDIKNSHFEKLLGVKLDNKLTFNSHISDLVSWSKRSCTSKISKKRNVMNPFLKLHFCPNVWMCHSRANHSKI